MPRVYKRKLGARGYKNYSHESLEKAVDEIHSGRMSIRAASKYFKIPFGTLHNKTNDKHSKRSGGQTALNVDEEKKILENACLCSEWGFPLSLFDVRVSTKIYLDSIGKTVKCFKKNLPGKEWAYSLLKRHKSIVSQRLATNITRPRAEVSVEVIKRYFDNLEKSIENVPPTHIFNYDETNVTDDPGKKLMIYKRGTKYPEKVMNHSKAATTVMMCGSASGVMLPPYIIYRSEYLWDNWREGGPKGAPCCTERCCSGGARYNRTSHGWMEASTFTDWFESVFLPHAARLERRKVLIGDNLASHFTDKVLSLCTLNNIAFVCLPPNSTHICQPLDVAFFKPFKTAWRDKLEEWKRTGPASGGIPKSKFPCLLKETLISMSEKVKIGGNNEDGHAINRDLKSGFEATGIYPFNPGKVLNKIPGGYTETVNPETPQHIESAIVQFLKEKRFGNTQRPLRQKRTRLDVEPGKSVAAQADTTSESESNIVFAESSAESEDPQEDNVEYSAVLPENIKVGSFVLARFLSGRRKTIYFRYLCIVEQILEENEYELVGCKSTTNKRTFKLVRADISQVNLTDIIAILPDPKLLEVSDTNIYEFPFFIDVKEV